MESRFYVLHSFPAFFMSPSGSQTLAFNALGVDLLNSRVNSHSCRAAVPIQQRLPQTRHIDQ